MMDPKEKQKLYLLFAIFGIVAFVVLFNLFLKPQFSRFVMVNREYSNVKKRISQAEILIANKSRLYEQRENLAREVYKIERRLPSQNEISTLLEDFSSVAESSGVKILRVKPLEFIEDVSGHSRETEYYLDFPILIEARAGYHQCGRFLNNLETMGRFIKIEDIDIRSRPQEPRHHDIRLRVKTYIVR